MNLGPSGYEGLPKASVGLSTTWEALAECGVRKLGVSTPWQDFGPFRQSHGAVVGLDSRGPRSEMLTVAEVASRLKVSKATVYTLVETGELPHVRVRNSIRVSLGVVEAYEMPTIPVPPPAPPRAERARPSVARVTVSALAALEGLA